MRVVDWYRAKTRSILKKYGPGPRVHYHVGVFRPDARIADQQELIRHQLTQSQEDMMTYASRFWGTPASLTGKRLLDVGAGLGGASLWMATHKDVAVDSLVQFADHAEVIRSFAALNGVASQIKVVQGDAHTYRPSEPQVRYDVVMALESPCYFDRLRWFRHLDSMLADGGEIWIEDVFISPEASETQRRFFDDYWRTDIGTVQEYEEAAEKAGFAVRFEDITSKTTHFWTLSAAWIERELAAVSDPEAEVRLQRSLHSARFHEEGWRSGDFRIGLFALKRA